MAAHELLATVDWQFWIPVGIAAASLLLTFRQMKRSGKRDTIMDLEKKIDKAMDALEDCEANLKQCGHEKDELRREKFALLEQIASMAAKAKPAGQGE